MFDKIGGLILAAVLFSISLSAHAADSPAGRPFKDLQQQIDRLTQQVGDLADRFTPPTIFHTLSCVDAFQVTLHLTVTDDKDIAYYVIQQQGGDPPMKILTFVEPGTASVNYSLELDMGSVDREFLLVAADMYGNVSKSLLTVKHDICVPVCDPGTICPE